MALASVVFATLLASPMAAGVTTSISYRDYVVEGTTAAGLVTFMNRNPLQGDHGHAYASIHPNYNLMVATRETGGMCRASVSVNLNFALTPPRAASPGGMGKSTRSAWNGFVNFARGHEEHHRASYTACTKAFVARAERQSAGQCLVLSSQIREMFADMKRDCEAKQRAFDRSQARVLPGLSLFAMARYQRRR